MECVAEAARAVRLLTRAWFEQLQAGAGADDETGLLVRAHFLGGAVLAVIGGWARGVFGREGSDPRGAAGVEGVAWGLARGRVQGVWSSCPDLCRRAGGGGERLAGWT
ncbi:hypothetical protein LG634_36090 [Streptomyces bambusae]|uniref:hypothetical protein n=1 Tax=Streptomyces bambusae TaxID=1550616 RepID=UPI001CFFB8B4|nr:hypothetical protein [Streptomyces bambusae]MCB5170207.1 hypothetical protein [Streptomyces bambusae]